MIKHSFHFGKNNDCLGVSVDGLPVEALLYEALRPESTKDTRESRRLLFYFYSQSILNGGTPPKTITTYIARLMQIAAKGGSIDRHFMPDSQRGSGKPSETKSIAESRWGPSPAYSESLEIIEAINPDLPRDDDTKRKLEQRTSTSYEKAGQTIAKAIVDPDQNGRRSSLTGGKLERQIRWYKKRMARLSKVQAILDQYYTPEGLGVDRQLTLTSQLQEIYSSQDTE